ncbi:MAG: LPD38 domain-containing protein, partial [Methanoregula sp.]
FKKPLDKMANLVSVMVESFNPMGASGVSAQSITPTALDPFIALAENKDWTGKQIFRENYSSLAPTPGFTRTKDTATWFSKNLSWALNRMSGGTDYKPGLFSPTPDQIDYLVGQFTGGVGRESTKIVQAAQSMATGEELPTYKIPLAGRFYGSTEGQSNQATTFYRNLKILNQHEAEIKGRQKNRVPLGDYLKDNPEARYWGMANKAEGTISRLTGMRRKLLEKDASKESIKAIDALITSHMKRFNETIKQAER